MGVSKFACFFYNSQNFMFQFLKTFRGNLTRLVENACYSQTRSTTDTIWSVGGGAGRYRNCCRESLLRVQGGSHLDAGTCAGDLSIRIRSITGATFSGRERREIYKLLSVYVTFEV